jgi:predicted negative regulator of RcsB-dependent stress response
LAKKKEAAPATAGMTGLEVAAERGLEIFKEYQNAIIAGLILAVALVAFVLWKVSTNEARDENAWKALAEVRRKKAPDMGSELAKLETTFAGTTAAPFISLTRATRLTEAGSRKELEEARDVLTKLLAESHGNELVQRVATLQLEGVKKELDDARTWKALEGAPKPPAPPAPPGSSTPPPPPAPPAAPAGDKK